MVAEPESERIVEMIDLRFCTLGPFQGTTVEVSNSPLELHGKLLIGIDYQEGIPP